MGKKPWTTEEQRVWLEALIPAFIQAQQDKATAACLEGTNSMWREKWPILAPTKDDIKGAKGSAEKALASKRKAAENVCFISFTTSLYLTPDCPACEILVSQSHPRPFVRFGRSGRSEVEPVDETCSTMASVPEQVPSHETEG